MKSQEMASTISGTPLVRSKLLIPSPAGLLHRPRVSQTIERGLEHKLTLLSAPAGYGKTSALVDFTQHSSMPVCWYTADERDRDLGVFIEYLVGAIRERIPGFGEHTQAALSSLAGDLSHDPTAVVGELTNEILEVDTPFAVVVDNYEALDGALGIQAFVHRLLELLPPNCHLMVGSRVLPSIPVTRLVAKRQLIGVTAKDLRFDPPEIQKLLKLSGIKVPRSQAEAIAANSEGWITGILLLADLLRGESQAALLDAERASTETYGYLAREVLNRQPPDLQFFLRTSAVLREMSPRLCRQILQIEEAGGLLTEVERRNLFVTRFGRGDTATYRYHNLFREFLEGQLRQRAPSRYTDMHLRAAQWFRQDNRVEDAVYHYLAAERYSEATALMEQVTMEWFTRGRVEMLLNWAEELPEDVRSEAPRLSLYQSRVLTDRYAYERARQALAHAETGFAARGDTTCLAKVRDQHAVLALLEGRYEDAIAEAQAALDTLGQDEVVERAGVQRHIGRAYVRLGQLPEGIDKLEDALALFRQTGSPYNVANVLQDIAHALTNLGALDEAAMRLNEALAIRRRLGAPVPLAGVLNNLGYLHYLRGEYRQALALYEEGLQAARRGGDPRWQTYVLIGMADIYRDTGTYERAELLYESAGRIGQAAESSLAVYLLVARADLHRWRGDSGQACALLRQARKLAEEKELDFEMRGSVALAEGIALAESGDLETALPLLWDAVRFLESRQAKHELARAHFLLAKAHLLNGDEPQAVAELHRAMDLANEIDTDQFAVVEGQHVEELLELGRSKGVAGCSDTIAEIQALRRFSEEQERGAADTAEDRPGRLEIYTFGEGRVVRDGHTVSVSEWQGALTKELFFYVLLHGPLERDAIGAVFWPELPKKKMTDSFHTTLYRLRRAVGGDAVVIREGRYQLGEDDYWLDVEEFESLVARARLLPPHDWQTENLWRRAASLYEGDFLPEVERMWCLSKREALREMYIEALSGIGRCHEVRKEFKRSIDWYGQALEVDELREDIHRRIMHCYAKAGRRSEALAQYEQCREILRRELDIEPSAETRELYERIAGRRPD